MKKLIYTLMLAGLLVTPMACNDQLDINHNPLAATTANPNVVFPFVMVQYSNRKITEIGTRCIDVFQNASATFNSPATGSTNSTLTGNMWGMLYTQVLSNATLVEKDAKASGATSNNVAAIAIILKALAFNDLTSLFGDVPYTEALDAAKYPSPHFDDQKTVLNGVVTLLDEAIALIDAMPASGNFTITGDLIYNGNMDSWRRFARSLQLRVLMMIRNNDTSVDPKIVSIVTEDKFINANSKIAKLDYDGSLHKSGFYGLLYAFFTGSNESDQVWGPTPVLRSLLYQLDDGVGGFVNDPRLDVWMIAGTNGTYDAMPVSQFPPDGTVAAFRDSFLSATQPDIWALPSEVMFYKAELALLGVIPGGAAQADTYYRSGLTLNLTYWTGSGQAAFIATKPALGTLTVTNAFNEIATQLYLDAFWRPVESWNTVRRTGIPVMDPYPGTTITTMLKRFNYPPAEIAANPNAKTNVPTDTKMWFEK